MNISTEIILLGLFLIGIHIGSFLHVVIDRLPRNESIGNSRSYCESCKHTLAWYDLLPLFSYLFLQGKCRYCHAHLSWYYPTIELLTGILFVYTFLWYQANFQSNLALQVFHFVSLGYYFFIVSSFIAIFFIDLKYGIIPDKIVFPLIVVSFLYQLFAGSDIQNILLSAFGAFFLFFFLHAVTKGRGMGFGDVKFVIFMGVVLGFPNILVGLYIAFLTGAFVSLILILWGKKKFRGGTIPFGPFLIFGTLLSLFGGEIIFRYASVLLFR